MAEEISICFAIVSCTPLHNSRLIPLQPGAVHQKRGRTIFQLLLPNGLPHPLEKMVIDTSANPGRRVIRQGYVEAVGSVMWLGEKFWTLTGAGKDAILAQDWLKCNEFQPGVLRIQSAEAPFTSTEGKQGDPQNRLRSLLFPSSKE